MKQFYRFSDYKCPQTIWFATYYLHFRFKIVSLCNYVRECLPQTFIRLLEKILGVVAFETTDRKILIRQRIFP